MISKQNSIKKKIEELKGPCKPKESLKPVKLEQAFNGAYSSYRINGRSRMGVDTFFDRIRQNLVGLMNKKLTKLSSAKVQTSALFRFMKASEDDFFGNVIEYDRAEMVFNSRMMEIFQGSDLNEIVDEMLAHMQMQIENSALANSRFVFNEVLYSDISFYQLNLT